MVTLTKSTAFASGPTIDHAWTVPHVGRAQSTEMPCQSQGTALRRWLSLAQSLVGSFCPLHIPECGVHYCVHISYKRIYLP